MNTVWVLVSLVYSGHFVNTIVPTMEFTIGYLMGSGANWPTILVTLLLCFVVAIIFKAVFGE